MATTKTSSKQTGKQPPTPPTLVLLVRHGQTPTTGKLLPGRAPGLHLADTGLEQARRAAERLGVLDRIDAVYASPLERTRETAAGRTKRQAEQDAAQRLLARIGAER